VGLAGTGAEHAGMRAIPGRLRVGLAGAGAEHAGMRAIPGRRLNPACPVVADDSYVFSINRSRTKIYL